MGECRLLIGIVAAAAAASLLILPAQVCAEEFPAPIELKSHFGTVSAVVFSPDSKTLLTGDGEFGKGAGKIWFWDVATWTEREDVYRHRNKIISLAYSPDGKYLASASIAEFLRPGELFVTFLEQRGRKGPLDDEVFSTWCVAISPDSKTLASAHDSGCVKLWDLPQATLRGALGGHNSRVTSLSYFPDGAILASAEGEGTIKLWDLADKREIASVVEEGYYVSSLAFSPDGKRLAVGGGKYDQQHKKWTSGGIRIWELATRKVVVTIDGHEEGVRAVAFHPGGKWLASASGFGKAEKDGMPGELRFWNPSNGTARFQIRLPVGINSLALSPDGKFLAAGCDDSTPRVWNVSHPPDTN